ncbi:uncharacterized protein [Watersipora subatra]|uniref:uncharacterized protein n=1 Tax=Watersipora subatra TaxID=2589382 RepID=UPI00355C7826
MLKPSVVRVQHKSVRKPRLAPPKIVTSVHLKYLNDRAAEEDRKKTIAVKAVFTRPSSVPGSILVTDDATSELGTVDETKNGSESTDNHSRPSTHNTIKDGIIIRWESEEKPLLRRPRTSTLYATPKRNSARLTRARFGVAMTKTKAKGIVNSLTQATIEAKHGKTAAQLCLEQSSDIDNPYHQHKNKLIRQYRLWNDRDCRHIELPPIQLGGSPTMTRRAQDCSRIGSVNQALHQLHQYGDVTNNVPPRSGHVFSRGSGYSSRKSQEMSRTIHERHSLTAIEQIRLAIGDLL